MNVRVYALLLALVIILAPSIPIVYAQQSTPPSINITPSMKVLVYPDGSIRVLYNLGIVIENAVENMAGNMVLSYSEKSTEEHMYVVFGGGGEVRPLIPGMEVSSSSFSIRSLFNIYGSSGGYLINGSMRVEASKIMGLERKYTVINVTRLTIAIRDQVIRLAFDIVAEGNITIPEEYIGENITNLIETQLHLKNITWIKLEHISIVKEDDVYHINGALMILIDEIIRQGLDFNIITKTDAEEISKCISEYYRNLNGIVKFNAYIFTTNYTSGTSALVFKFEAISDLHGEIKQIAGVSRRCSSALSKLSMIIPFLMMVIQTSQPQQPLQMIPSFLMPETKPPNLEQVYPHEASAKLSIKLEADKVIINITADLGRMTYVEHVDDPTMQAKLSLRELSSWLQQLDKQLSLLALMGIPSPIPSTIELEGVKEEGKSIAIEPSKATVQGLGEVNVRITSATKTTATPLPSTKTTPTLPTPPSPSPTLVPAKTTTVTKTYTTTVTTTLTKTYTEALTIKETTTVVKEGMLSISAAVVIVASIVSIIIVIVLVLVLLKILRR